jgi:hypothetical protein
VIDGLRAVELARLTQGLPGWPGLHRYQRRAHPERVERVRVPLAAAELDVDVGWPLDAYAYPVPRERVEAELPASLPSSGKDAAWWDKVSTALRGVEWAIFEVACELARRDRALLAN